MKRAKTNGGSAVRAPARPASGSSLTTDKTAADASWTGSNLQRNSPHAPAKTPNHRRACVRDQKPLAPGDQPLKNDLSQDSDEDEGPFGQGILFAQRHLAESQSLLARKMLLEYKAIIHQKEMEKDMPRYIDRIAAAHEEAPGPMTVEDILAVALSLADDGGNDGEEGREDDRHGARGRMFGAGVKHVGILAEESLLEEQQQEDDDEGEAVARNYAVIMLFAAAFMVEKLLLKKKRQNLERTERKRKERRDSRKRLRQKYEGNDDDDDGLDEKDLAGSRRGLK